MHASTLGTALLVTLVAGATCGATCVRGPDDEFDCTTQAAAFAEAFKDDGKLLDEIPDRKAYPMALVMSEDGLNELLTGVVSDKLPFASAITLGPMSLNFQPTNQPKIELIKVPNCGKCVQFSVEFGFYLTNMEGEAGLGGGSGKAVLTIPLSLQQNDDGSSSLVAEYQRSVVRDLNFRIMGIESTDHQSLEGALEILATEQLRTQFTTKELLRFEPWTIGNGEVKLSARDFAISYDNKVVSFGMATNLDIPPQVSVKVATELQSGLPMLIQMHPGLLLAMAQRMITEGEISRTYNDDGQPDPDGLYGMTLEGMSPNKIPDSNTLDVFFRVWRTEDGYCGYADAQTELRLGLDGNRITVAPTDKLEVTGGAGVGELAATDEELVQKNKKLVDTFKKDLSEQVGITVNYDQLGVAGTRILFQTAGLKVRKTTIDIAVDFQVVAAE